MVDPAGCSSARTSAHAITSRVAIAGTINGAKCLANCSASLAEKGFDMPLCGCSFAVPRFQLAL